MPALRGGMPQLHFVYDQSIEQGEHLSSLIDKAVAGSEDRGQGPED